MLKSASYFEKFGAFAKMCYVSTVLLGAISFGFALTAHGLIYSHYHLILLTAVDDMLFVNDTMVLHLM